MLNFGFATLVIVFVEWSYGSKCQMRGLVDGKIRCIFHNRGANVEKFSSDQNELNEINTNCLSDTEEQSESSSKHIGAGTNLDSKENFVEGDSTEEFIQSFKAYFPEARWCGEKTGYRAHSYDDLVLYVETEKCCQKHDECTPVIKPRGSEGNLTNFGLLPRFHCDCEEAFFKCLKKIYKIGSPGNKIGVTYFTVFGPQCFREDNPATECTNRTGNLIEVESVSESPVA